MLYVARYIRRRSLFPYSSLPYQVVSLVPAQAGTYYAPAYATSSGLVQLLTHCRPHHLLRRIHARISSPPPRRRACSPGGCPPAPHPALLRRPHMEKSPTWSLKVLHLVTESTPPSRRRPCGTAPPPTPNMQSCSVWNSVSVVSRYTFVTVARILARMLGYASHTCSFRLPLATYSFHSIHTLHACSYGQRRH